MFKKRVRKEKDMRNEMVLGTQIIFTKKKGKVDVVSIDKLFI